MLRSLLTRSVCRVVLDSEVLLSRTIIHALLNKVLQEYLLFLVLNFIQGVAVARHFLDTSGDVVLNVNLLSVVLVRLGNLNRK